METDTAGTVQAVYNYGNDLISMKRADVNSFYLYDGLGSVKQLTDDSETVVASYTYDSFGSLIASSGSITNAYGFTGEQFDSSSELLYLRARYYNPAAGRFLSRDPIGYEGGINLYAYVRNNPVNYTDPKGKCPARDKCIEDAYVTFSLCMSIGEAIIKAAEDGFKDCLSDCGKRMPPIAKEICKGTCVAVWGPLLAIAYDAGLSFEAGCEIGLAADLMDCSLVPCPCP
ncbi:MAG: RHS repeat-associated core domain-containing protein [Phycisphaerae bacterium]|nr:RHS repeat-associated core domain-containing protein [Phycisphaerae bacterium]MDD5380729.1 RHS repeat-associated core domain-containing protein [Phycisphaerae bacterium]